MVPRDLGQSSGVAHHGRNGAGANPRRRPGFTRLLRVGALVTDRDGRLREETQEDRNPGSTGTDRTCARHFHEWVAGGGELRRGGLTKPTTLERKELFNERGFAPPAWPAAPRTFKARRRFAQPRDIAGFRTLGAMLCRPEALGMPLAG